MLLLYLVIFCVKIKIKLKKEVINSLKHECIYLFVFITGTGFKTAPVVARLLSELARGVEPFLDVSYYNLSRFSK